VQPHFRRDRVLSQLLGGLITFSLILAATFVTGRVFLPSTESALGDITGTLVTTTTQLDPRRTLDDLPYPAAAVVISGAIEDRLILDRVVREATIGRGPDPSSNDIEIRYTDGGSTLTLIVRGVTIGVAHTEPFTVILTTAGQTFSAHPGDCNLLIDRFEYTSLPPTPPLTTSRLVATFAGQLTCTNVLELRTRAAASFFAAFDY